MATTSSLHPPMDTLLPRPHKHQLHLSSHSLYHNNSHNKPRSPNSCQQQRQRHPPPNSHNSTWLLSFNSPLRLRFPQQRKRPPSTQHPHPCHTPHHHLHNQHSQRNRQQSHTRHHQQNQPASPSYHLPWLRLWPSLATAAYKPSQTQTTSPAKPAQTQSKPNQPFLRSSQNS